MEKQTGPRIILEKAEPDFEVENRQLRDSSFIKEHGIPSSMKPISSQYKEHLEKKRLEAELLQEQIKKEEDLKLLLYTVGGLLIGGALIYIGKQYFKPIITENTSKELIETGNEIIQNTNLLNKNI